MTANEEALTVTQEEPCKCAFCGNEGAPYIAFPQSDTPWHVAIDHAENCPMWDLDSHCYASKEAAFDEWTLRHGDYVDLEKLFDLRWKADMRAIERWRAANPGNELVLPDHADLVVWLLDQLARPSADVLVEALERIESAKVAFNAHPVGAIATIQEWARQALATFRETGRG